MRKIAFMAAVAALVFVQSGGVTARMWEEIKKEKKVHNQYVVQPSDKLVFENMYGQVHINTWDKNEVTVDITVTTKARKEADAQEVMDRISFIIESNENGGHRISYRTILDKARRNIENINMTIDYVINAPKGNAVEVTNRYGDVFLADFSGKVNMNVSYGSLEMLSITGGDKRIKVAFGNATVSSIETGTFDMAYSNLTIDRAGDIDVTSKYGNTDIGTVRNFKVNQRYGNVDLGSVNQLSGDFGYTNVDIGSLVKNADVDLKYCGRANFKSIGTLVDRVKALAKYSSMYVHIADGANLSVDVATGYSDVKKGSLLRSIDTEDGSDPGKTMHYKGKIGHGDGTVEIEAKYSNINFR